MTNWQKSLSGISYLVIMFVFAYWQTLAPEVRGNSELDSTALDRHVSFIAQKPHPMGSAAHGEVRDYIVAYFESLGLETEVQKTTVVYRHPTRPARATIIGNVENIIARLPGRGASGTQGANDLVVMGHYDSRPLTPGAGDDASGSAAIMETARIMAAAPAPVHDVIFLITDGEEMGLLGAQGFFRQHPAAKQVGLVLNFEARGSYGASFMFETSKNNAWLVGELIESAPDLQASSLAYEIYRQMPNDTDMSISKGEGIPGLNFAFTAGLFDYHAMTDNPGNLDVRSLAQQANYVLASAQHFANLERWQTAGDDLTYFNLWRGTLVSYSEDLAVALGLLVLLAGGCLFFIALRAGVITRASMTSGLLGVLIILLVIYSLFASLNALVHKADAGIMRMTSLGEWPFLAFFIITLGLVLWFGRHFKRGLSTLDLFLPSLALVLLAMLTGNVTVSAFVPPLILVPLMLAVRLRNSRPDLGTAALIGWWLMTALVLYFAPNASYFFVWPLASVLLGVALRRALSRVAGGRVRFLSVLVFSFIPLLLLPSVYILAYLALGLALPQVLMMICALSLLLIWPLIRSTGSVVGGKTGPLLLAAGLIMTIAGLFGLNFDSRYPRGEEIFYAIDVEKKKGFWVSPDARPGSWLGNFMGVQANKTNMTHILPGYDQVVLTRESVLPAFEPAVLTVKGDRLIEGARELSLHLRPAGTAEYINLLFASDAGISSAAVNGFPVEMPGTQQASDPAQDPVPWWRWRLYGVGKEGVEIVVRLVAGQSVPVRIVEVDYTRPEGMPARPENSMSKPYSWSDSTVIFQTVKLE